MRDYFFQRSDHRFGFAPRKGLAENLEDGAAIMRPHSLAQYRALFAEHREGAASVAGCAPAREQPFALEPVKQARDVIGLDHQALAEFADAQPSARALKLEQQVVPGERRLAGGLQLRFDGGARQRVRAEEMAPGANCGFFPIHDPLRPITNICICNYMPGWLNS